MTCWLAKYSITLFLIDGTEESLIMRRDEWSLRFWCSYVLRTWKIQWIYHSQGRWLLECSSGYKSFDVFTGLVFTVIVGAIVIALSIITANVFCVIMLLLQQMTIRKISFKSLTFQFSWDQYHHLIHVLDLIACVSGCIHLLISYKTLLKTIFASRIHLIHFV